MEIIKGKQLIEDVFNYDIVLFGMGINNSMNNGFSYEISLNFPEVKENEDLTGYGDIRKYGKVNETVVDSGLKFYSCYCYNIGLKSKNNGEYIDYDALQKCLMLIKQYCTGKRIASPIIGQDKYDGNGNKDKIINIFKEVFGDDENIVLYDFVQQDFKQERYKEAVVLRKKYTDGLITKNEFKHLKKLNEWKRLNGIFKVMPDEFEYKPKRKSKGKIIINKQKKLKNN